MATSSLINDRIFRKTQDLMNSGLKNTIDESTAPFAKSFFKRIVTEAEEPVPGMDSADPDDFTPEKNKQDFEQSLGDTPPEQFDVEGKSPEVTGGDLSKIKEFSDKLEEFAEFLNDYKTGHSMHSILSNNDKQGSVLRGVSRKASDSITRISGEVTKLREVLNSFIITAPKKLQDLAQVQQIQA